jgi:hypothetical protein
VLVAFELASQPVGDFFAKLHYLERVGGYGKIHNCLLSISSQFLIGEVKIKTVVLPARDDQEIGAP